MPFATIARRGCGDQRTPNGLYAECGLGEHGSPLEAFLVDPVVPLPAGLDLVNKPQLWEDRRTGLVHLMLWIGEQWYPHMPDYIEEVRRFGASRRIPVTLDLSRLTPGRSRMIVAHPRARVDNWHVLTPPHVCRKKVEGHTWGQLRVLIEDGRTVDGTIVGQEQALIGGWDDEPEFGRYGQRGPCLFKTYDLIPGADGSFIGGDTDGAHYIRRIADTSYAYTPTGEEGKFSPAIFAALPLHGFSIVAPPKERTASVNYRLRAWRDWALRFGTFTALWLVAMVVTLALGALCVWLAYIGDLPARIGVNEAIFASVVPPLIVLVVIVWQGRIWRRDWLWRRWYIKVD